MTKTMDANNKPENSLTREPLKSTEEKNPSVKASGWKRLIDRDFPQELKTMDVPELELLALEIREFLLAHISKTGGHLASNLGVVELTIALHKFLDTPKDKLVFDVGHQSYVHKILTGRASQFDTLRQMNGLSGFPKRKEGPFDVFDTGHSSTSIALINGLAMARDLKGEDYRTVCVIGDGSMSGGLAYEALNNLGGSKTKALVILNDNQMSIGTSTGGFENYLGKLRVSKGYSDFKQGLSKTVERMPRVGDSMKSGLRKMRNTLKYALMDGVLFEELGFTYFGPVDGHDIEALLAHLALADACEGPAMLHVITKKGKGYKNAEEFPETFHGTGSFDQATGLPLKAKKGATYSDLFGKTMVELGKEQENLVAISAAMVTGTGLGPFAEAYPLRTFDVGIAESYGVTFSGALAMAGMRPVVAIYSTFLQRAYDQMLMDVCLENLPVVFAIDRSGNVGPDGETHHGIFDLSYLGSMPHMTVWSPRDGKSLQHMLKAAMTTEGPLAIRYPRGEAVDLPFPVEEPFTGAVQVLRPGRDCEIWAVGNMVQVGMEVVSLLEDMGIQAGLVDPVCVKPLDCQALEASAQRVPYIFTLEDNVLSGGFGEKVAARLCNSSTVVKSICWPDAFLEQGTPQELYDKYGFQAATLAERIRDILEGKTGYSPR